MSEPELVPGFSRTQIEALVVAAAPTFADASSEHHWLAVHQGAHGPLVDERLYRRRALAARQAVKKANTIPTWRPFLLTRQGRWLLVHSIAKRQGFSGDYAVDWQMANEPILRLSLSHALGHTRSLGPRSRLSPLAARS